MNSEPQLAAHSDRDFSAPLAVFKKIAIFLTIVASYFITSKIGLALAFSTEQVTAVWPPTGIALAAALLWGYRAVPAIALGAFLTNITANEPVAVALGITIGNTLEAVIGATLLNHFGFDRAMQRLKDVLLLVFLAALASTMVSATIGVASLCSGGLQPWENYFHLWLLWWIGDAAGALIVAPLILVWAQPFYQALSPLRWLEAFLLATAILVSSLCVFTEFSVVGSAGRGFIYVIFPCLIWASLRFFQRGTTAVTFVSSGIAIWATVHGLGPFTSDSINQSLMLLQSFMAIVSVTGLMLGASMTERRNAESANRKNQASLSAMAAIVESSDDAIVSKNMDQIITSWNDGAKKLFGYDASEAIGRPIGMIIPPDRAFEEKHIIEKLYRGERIHHYETERLTKDGRRIEISLSISPIYDDENNIVGASKISRDITHRKRIERENNKLLHKIREDDQRKDEFLATLAHELRNPMAPIYNALHVLQASPDSKRRDEALSLAERQLMQVMRLVDDLLDISRIATGKIAIHKKAVLLTDFLSSALETSQPLIAERHHELKKTLPADPVWVYGDDIRLSQIFSNLLNNAAKYTDKGGVIELEAVLDKGDVVIAIRDNGMGIPQEIMPYIFDMFARGDNAQFRAQDGLGIGLALVKKLVDLHGGSINVQSRSASQGSEFIVRLPVHMMKEDEIKTSRISKEDLKQGQSRRVLIVDDNQDSAKTLGWMVELLGHEIHLAHNGNEAIKAAEEHKPDIVLLDIGLPDINGYEVCRIMRKNPALENTLFIAQTGWGQAEHMEWSRQAGFHHHLVKPVDASVLNEIIRAATS